MMIKILQLSLLWACANVRETSGAHSMQSSWKTHHAFIASPYQVATQKDVTCLMPQRMLTALSSTIGPHRDKTKFNFPIHSGENTSQMLRNELKSRLLKAADDFKTMKSKESEIALKAQESDEKANTNEGGTYRGYVIRLLHRIVRKVLRRNKSSKKPMLTESQGILTSDSFRQMKLEVGTTGNQVIELAEQLSQLNPTPIPTLGFRNYGGASPAESKLGGNWKLRFTTAADASFAESRDRGIATTSQEVDAEEGTFTNVVDFEKGSLKGFRVVVEGEPTSATDIGLTFKSVKILRNSRFPRLFGQFTFRLPSSLIRWLSSRGKAEEEVNKGPYLQLRYLDDDLRMHITDSGNWFIQTRLG
mmetsp:Transcript_7954/g.14366  ORF Transcript_7954/g.14366 Transcript_7954/m.14366 type:complete len:361 (+) Transcript_7954:60-1142(+)|eukprot:CAMPEP_0201604398 /NCGR_PEP_ID=MMETSP0492-20130828/4554_1 /ASSEMBLY_ACC=CAM_ASM_000837 /TAXON_ID=420259 /ORGANISM="Thalassiosira gravida, Strain GMp14c1" /LENGTH=360 /DNA_ID=CAMNT_0048068421 /DNA_START=60 /DNA_END=1142 /DNA_ORIENTATION=-